MSHKTLKCFLLPTLCLIFNNCATAPTQKSIKVETAEEILREAQEDAEDSSKDAKEYMSIDRLYREKSYDLAIERAKTFVGKYTKSKYADLVESIWGLSLIAQKQYTASIQNFKKAMEITARNSVRNMSLYNLAYVYFELGQHEITSQYLERIQVLGLETKDRIKFHTLNAKTARIQQNYALAAREILNAAQFGPEGHDSNAYRNFLGDSIELVDSIPVIDTLISEFEDSQLADELYFRRAIIASSSGDKERSKSLYAKIIADYPTSRHFVIARDAMKKLELQSFVDPKRIGVLLTLSGKFGSYGYRALQGVQLALGMFNKTHSAETGLTLVVIDDQGSPQKAIAGLEELFYKHQVSAVIGPLVSKLAEPVGKKAQELGLPLISLTQKAAIGGNFIFNASLTPEIQVRQIVDYAVNTAGIKRFAVLAPANKFGEEYTNAFWDEIEKQKNNSKNGAEISVRGFELYPNDETDFRKYIDNMTGLSAVDARNKEVEELKLLKAATPVKVRSKKFDRMFDLKPIIDFQAVFIPDEPKALGQILPTFAYRDVENTIFLGINTWNSPELLARAGNFAQGSVFVDGFYSGSSKGLSQEFIQKYRDTYNAEPGLIDALAFDAGNILRHLMSNKPIASRSELRSRIEELSDFPGVSGKISYRDGRLTKQLHLLTVNHGKIEEIASP